MTITLRDITNRVGRPITTASRALHNYSDVSLETKLLVRQVAEEMGYMPNIQAQRLQKQRTDTIGLILPAFGPRFSEPFFSEILAGIGNEAARRGFDLLVSTRSPGDQEMAAYREVVAGRRVDGFIVVRTRCEDPRINYLNQVKFP